MLSFKEILLLLKCKYWLYAGLCFSLFEGFFWTWGVNLYDYINYVIDGFRGYYLKVDWFVGKYVYIAETYNNNFIMFSYGDIVIDLLGLICSIIFFGLFTVFTGLLYNHIRIKYKQIKK